MNIYTRDHNYLEHHLRAGGSKVVEFSILEGLFRMDRLQVCVIIIEARRCIDFQRCITLGRKKSHDETPSERSVALAI